MLFYRRVDDIVSPTVTIQDVFNVLPPAALYTLPIPQVIVDRRVPAIVNPTAVIPQAIVRHSTHVPVVVNSSLDTIMPDQDDVETDDEVFFINLAIHVGKKQRVTSKEELEWIHATFIPKRTPQSGDKPVMFSWMDYKRAESLGWKFFKMFMPQSKKIPVAERIRQC